MSSYYEIPVIIPAYEPDEKLIALLHALQFHFNTIIPDVVQHPALKSTARRDLIKHSACICLRLNSTRVCYIRRGDVPRWVNNSYTAYEASPVSVVFRSVNLGDAPTDWMVQEKTEIDPVFL